MDRMWKSSLWTLLPLTVSSVFPPSFQVLRTSQVGPVSHSPARLPFGLSARRLMELCDLLPLPPPIPSFPPHFHPFVFFLSLFFIHCILSMCFPFLISVQMTPYLHSHSSPITPRTYKTGTGSNQTTAQHGEGEVNAMPQEVVFKW